MNNVSTRVKRLLTILILLGLLTIAVLIFATERAAADPPRPQPAKCQESATVCLVKKYWKNADTQPAALRVARCESKFNEKAQNPSGARGIFQLMPVHSGRAAEVGARESEAREPYSWDEMYDAGKNTRVAEDLYNEQGWDPWECSP